MLKTIKLYGILAKNFGKEFHLAVDNTREAMRAFAVNIGDDGQHLLAQTIIGQAHRL